MRCGRKLGDLWYSCDTLLQIKRKICNSVAGNVLLHSTDKSPAKKIIVSEKQAPQQDGLYPQGTQKDPRGKEES